MLPQIKHSLFATDFSRNACEAAKHAAGLALATGASVHVLHVVEPLSEDARFALMAFIQDPKLRHQALENRTQAARAMVAQREEQFWATLDQEQKAVRERMGELEVVEGFPPHEILERANGGRYDMLVMGGHEHGISHSFMGDTAKRVLRRVTIPTLIVPRGHA